VKINKYLKEQRKKAKLTQAKIAKLAGISERAYQQYEADKRIPNVYTAQLIAQALHTTVEELFPLPASANAGGDKPDDSQENK
jgi:transcriptional regulator with XRE-family HTH domain